MDWFHAMVCDVHLFLHPSLVLASYLAVHEFEVDSFQRDLQQSSFTSFHILDRELSAQLWTYGQVRQVTSE